MNIEWKSSKAKFLDNHMSNQYTIYHLNCNGQSLVEVQNNIYLVFSKFKSSLWLRGKKKKKYVVYVYCVCCN